jgi:hypothetical protein
LSLRSVLAYVGAIISAPLLTIAILYAFTAITMGAQNANDAEGLGYLIFFVLLSVPCLALAIPAVVLVQRALVDFRQGISRIVASVAGLFLMLIFYGLAFEILTRSDSQGSIQAGIFIVPALAGITGFTAFFVLRGTRQPLDDQQ